MRQRTPVGLGISALLLTVASVATLQACSVPVFRYALERWPADDYRITVVHRGPLTEAQQALVDRLDPESESGPKTANLRVRLVDLDDDSNDAAARDARDAAIESLGGQVPDELPAFIVGYPASADIPPAWSGPLNEENVAALIDSPVRREIARRLLKGETAVWVFLESGDKEKDDNAYETLKTELALAGLNLKLPEIDQQDVADGLVSIELDQLRVAFSIVRVSRSDPAESLFAEMLLGSEGTRPDSLRDPQFVGEPMAFPVFGRGRALYALVGKGINEEMIATASATLVGPCTCEVKDQNPGIDLLMSISWDDLVKPTIDIDQELPPLAGLTSFVADENSPEDNSDSETAPDQLAQASPGANPPASTNDPPRGDAPSAAASIGPAAPDRAQAQAAVPEERTGAADPASENSDASAGAGSNTVLRNTLVLVGLAAAVVIVASLLVVRRG